LFRTAVVEVAGAEYEAMALEFEGLPKAAGCSAVVSSLAEVEQEPERQKVNFFHHQLHIQCVESLGLEQASAYVMDQDAPGRPVSAVEEEAVMVAIAAAKVAAAVEERPA